MAENTMSEKRQTKTPGKAWRNQSRPIKVPERMLKKHGQTGKGSEPASARLEAVEEIGQSIPVAVKGKLATEPANKETYPNGEAKESETFREGNFEGFFKVAGESRAFSATDAEESETLLEGMRSCMEKEAKENESFRVGAAEWGGPKAERWKFPFGAVKAAWGRPPWIFIGQTGTLP